MDFNVFFTVVPIGLAVGAIYQAGKLSQKVEDYRELITIVEKKIDKVDLKMDWLVEKMISGKS